MAQTDAPAPQKTRRGGRRHHALKVVLCVLLGLIAALVAGFLAFTANPMRADAIAVEAATTHTNVSVVNGLYVVTPAPPTEKSSETAIAFYPGANVESIAYLPILEQVANSAQVMCVLVPMPRNVALLDINGAERAFAALPSVHTWYVAGHSLGGAMASLYAAGHQDRVAGLILMGAYVYGDYPTSHALTIYGSLDAKAAESVTYAENVVVIEGGNHAQFGNYGLQPGDGTATVSREEQQRQAVEAITPWVPAAA